MHEEIPESGLPADEILPGTPHDRIGERLYDFAVSTLACSRMLCRLVMDVRAGFPKRPPVIVYSQNKAGTSSLQRSLVRQYGKNAYHTHSLNPKRPTPPERFPRDAHRVVHRAFVEKPAPLRIISMVREPVARMFSYFFHAYFRDRPVEDAPEAERLRKILVAWARATEHVDWFREELIPTTGIDIFAQPFDHDAGFAVFEQGETRLLVLKLETPDAVKEDAVRDFLEMDAFTWERLGHVGAEKEYADLYAELKKSPRLPEDVVTRFQAIPSASHFYAEEDLAAARERWMS